MPNACPRVLVVDDNEDIRAAIRCVLEDASFAVFEANNGAAALQVLRDSKADVVVLDLMMPVMSGWTFARQCRRIDGCGDLPIIAVSAMLNTPDSAATLRELGVRAYLAKPFDIELLLSLVATMS